MATITQSPAPAASGPTHPFTCNTCQVAFRSSDLQRTHMQSDWHRYNLKRRVASLPPLTSEIFAEKVLANKASAAATAARASFEKICPPCQKTYYSENAYQNHIGSQKHKLQVLKMQMREGNGDDAETGSIMSSTFSLGEPLETASTKSIADDPEAEAEFSEVVAAIEDTKISEPESPVSRRPSRPHHSGMEDRTTEHPVSESATDASEEDLVEVPLDQCLFCNQPSGDTDANVTHMSKQHGMFIPEREYLVDLEGLLGYLHEKIYDFHECLYCGQTKHTVSGVQTHMRDRGHCMIPYGTEDEMIEIGEFYDFRSTYSDDEGTVSGAEEGRLEGGVKLGAARATKVTVDNGTGAEDEMLVDEDDEGWESDASSLSSVPTDEITAMPIDDHSHRYKTLDQHRHHSHNDPRPHRNLDGFHSHAHATPHAVYHDDYELHLPSGRTAGHRSLHKYFRQNLRNYPSPAERAHQRTIEGRHDSDEELDDTQQSRQRDRGRQLMSRANGGTGMIGVTDAKKREIRAAEKRTQKREQRAQANYQWGNNKQSNFQKHFRDPLLQ